MASIKSSFRSLMLGAYSLAGIAGNAQTTQQAQPQAQVLAQPLTDAEKDALTEQMFAALKANDVEKAKELLQYTTFNVSEVSLQVGFKSIFHFSKVFRQLSGRNPSEFKQFRYQPK